MVLRSTCAHVGYYRGRQVQQTVTGVPGGLELLVSAGFTVVFEAGTEGAEEGWAVWKPSADSLAALRGCLRLMDAAYPPPPPPAPSAPDPSPIPAPASSTVTAPPTSAAAGPAPPRPRNTRVFLPSANTSAQRDPGESFFARSTAEVSPHPPMRVS